MLNKVKNRKEQGFTIIEVLIVLAIAGLIMLVVFLAIPALQRQQRNEQRRSEAARAATSANDLVTNGAGKIPEGATNAGVIVNNASIGTGNEAGQFKLTGTAPASPFACGATPTMTADNLHLCNTNGTTITGVTAPASADGILVVMGGECNGANAINAVTSQRQIAVIYTIEQGGGTRSLACINA